MLVFAGILQVQQMEGECRFHLLKSIPSSRTPEVFSKELWLEKDNRESGAILKAEATLLAVRLRIFGFRRHLPLIPIVCLTP